MKNFIFWLCFLIALPSAFSQIETNTSFSNQMNTVFSPLDKTKVPHGILLDFGMDFTNVSAFNGTLTDSTYSTLTRLKQIYSTLLSSRIRNVNAGFVTPQQFSAQVEANRSSNAIAITGLFFKYAQFGPNAIANNKITYTQGKLYDKYVSGFWQNPYLQKNTFAMAPAIKFYKGLDLTIKIPSSTFYSNYSSQVQSIQIDFNNGQGYVSVPFNQNISVNYNNEGTKTWKYKLTLTDNTIMYSHSLIKIEESIKTQSGARNSNSSCFRPDVNITGATSYLGSFGSVKLTIDDADCDGIKKPLIVVEGFDVGEIVTPENPEGQFDYGDFRDFVLSGGTQLTNLIRDDNKNYDIIYVDWDNGLDYLQRNAYALQEVIAYVNQQKALNSSTEDNVILGQSMGGVIARWALADMEENSVDHETRLFISHDAPQQGANMPLAIQFMYRHITNLYIEANQTILGSSYTIPIAELVFDASSYLSLLDVPATKQLLKVRSTLNYTGNNTAHDAFYNELRGKGLSGSGGYPVNSRNIALSNGSECGETQNLNPGENLFRLYSDTKLSFLEDLASIVVLPLGGFLGGVLVNENLFNVALLGLVPGNSRFNIHFWGKAMTYTNGTKIYNGNISYSKRVLWLGPTIVTQITQVEKDQFNNMLPFDYYGGGFYNVSNAIDTNNLPSELSLTDSFNFIPTASALDIGNDQISLFDSDYLRPYVGELPPTAPKDTPFANFSTEYDINPNANSNQQHISFNTRSGDWLASELVATNIEFTNCAFTCSTAEIAGPDRFCSGSRIYNAPLGGDTYQWSIEGSAAFIQSGGTSSSVTISKSQLVQGGWVTLHVDITSARCSANTNNPITVRITKHIYVGVPSYEFIEEVSTLETGLSDPIAPIGSCDDLGFKLNIAPSNQEILEVDWEKVTTNYEWSHADDEYVIITPSCNEPIEFRVRFRNNCGWSSWHNIVYDITQCTSDCSASSGNITSNNFVIYPVPADTSLTIKLKNQPVGLLQNGDTLNIKLFNSSGWLVSEVNAVATQTTLNVSNLISGIYVLVLNYNGQIESHQIVIN